MDTCLGLDSFVAETAALVRAVTTVQHDVPLWIKLDNEAVGIDASCARNAAS